ncbi:hypothetical protein LLEC1_07154 [Akanthomyces lecanii]|uniref:Uncharacterized protein n=1 Tax=Cordyceps confragosa TaxID=2714763 RepID=A0A179ILM7_CORDF|nr:hypothetical protein LLEC1_07154 [Akanthomyces lecanii]
MADASADPQCTKNCGPQEIWIWSETADQASADGNHNYADANTIRNCQTCKAKFSAEFNIPDIWWAEYNRRANGYFGSQDLLDGAENVTGYGKRGASSHFTSKPSLTLPQVTWSHFLTKQVHNADYRYEWIKINIFTQWFRSQRQVVLSFAQGKGKMETQDRIRETLLDSLVARELIDPFWVYHKLLSLVLDLNDRSIWKFRDCVRPIETSKKHKAKPPDYFYLYNLARHGIHIAEVLGVTLETIQRINSRHRVWIEDSRQSIKPPLPGHAFIRSVEDRLSFYEQTVSSFRHRMLSTKDRLTNEINLSFNLIAQTDSKVTLAGGQTMKRLTIMSVVFLPATFVSAIFSTSFFNFSPEAKRWTVSPMFWVYWAVAIPVTIVIPVAWRLWDLWEHPALPRESPRDEGGAANATSQCKPLLPRLKNAFRQ